LPTIMNAEIGQGDGLVLEVTITEPDNADTADFAWALWRFTEDPLALLRTADLDIAAGDEDDPDVVTITVPGAATADLPQGSYHHELKMQLPDGQPETLVRGTLGISASAVKDQVVVEA
jgi:hypothetical protein